MNLKKIKFTIGSRVYEVKTKHVVLATIATTSYIAIMYRNRCENLSVELAQVTNSRDSWREYAKLVSEGAVNAGVASVVDSKGRQKLVFAYDI